MAKTKKASKECSAEDFILKKLGKDLLEGAKKASKKGCKKACSKK